MENSERLQYPVTPSQEPSGQQEAASGGGQGGGGLGRRVSRVESLRRLLLGASSMDSRRLFDRKKQRYTVDKSIGKDYNFYVFRFVIYNLQVQILVTMERRTCLTGKVEAVERCRLKNHIFVVCHVFKSIFSPSGPPVSSTSAVTALIWTPYPR